MEKESEAPSTKVNISKAEIAYLSKVAAASAGNLLFAKVRGLTKADINNILAKPKLSWQETLLYMTTFFV